VGQAVGAAGIVLIAVFLVGDGVPPAEALFGAQPERAGGVFLNSPDGIQPGFVGMRWEPLQNGLSVRINAVETALRPDPQCPVACFTEGVNPVITQAGWLVGLMTQTGEATVRRCEAMESTVPSDLLILLTQEQS
jgi:hypothetical protein